MILAETGDLHRFASGRAVVKHAGLNPSERTSATMNGQTRISRRGRAGLRSAAWRAVWAALRHNRVLVAKYAHRTGRDGNRLADGQARTACAATLLRWLWAVITRRQAWDARIAAGLTLFHGQDSVVAVGIDDPDVEPRLTFEELRVALGVGVDRGKPYEEDSVRHLGNACHKLIAARLLGLFHHDCGNVGDASSRKISRQIECHLYRVARRESLVGIAADRPAHCHSAFGNFNVRPNRKFRGDAGACRDRFCAPDDGADVALALRIARVRLDERGHGRRGLAVRRCRAGRLSTGLFVRNARPEFGFRCRVVAARLVLELLSNAPEESVEVRNRGPLPRYRSRDSCEDE